MTNFLRWVLSTRFARAFMTSEIRHLATLAAGFVLGWLGQHGFLQGDAASIAEGVGAIIMGLGGYGMSKINSSNNKAVAQAAAQTGQVLPPAVAKAVVARAAADKKANDFNEKVIADVKSKADALPGADVPVVPAAVADELRRLK